MRILIFVILTASGIRGVNPFDDSNIGTYALVGYSIGLVTGFILGMIVGTFKEVEAFEKYA